MTPFVAFHTLVAVVKSTSVQSEHSIEEIDVLCEWVLVDEEKTGKPFGAVVQKPHVVVGT
jgi:hypothetical protein